MSLESIFKLSVVMNMIDNLSSPMASVTSNVDSSVNRLQNMNQTFGDVAKTGVAMAGVGAQITSAVLDPVEATFATRKAIGELASLGVKDLATIESAAKDFSDTWAGTTKADFITAAYDIKSGISSLTDEGVAQYTEMSGLTAKATKSTIGEMTDLFATGYGIYKNFYSDLSDMEFGEMFSAGISESVRAFKTSGSGMAQGIKTLGASATTANVPLEEQLSILGMLQATMSGSEAGTKYKAFLRSATKGGEELGLKFTDANNQLLSMPEILEMLRGKFGETMDAAEKMELQKAFGDAEAVALIDLLYSKTGDLQNNILNLYDTMGQGTDVAKKMATAINETEPEKYERLKQQIQNTKESIGNTLLPTINELLGKGGEVVANVGDWIESHQSLVRTIMIAVLIIGGFLTVAGTTIALVGSVGLVFTKTAGMVGSFIGVIKRVPSLLETIYIKGLYAGDGLKLAFTKIKGGATTVLTSMKNVTTSVLTFAKTAAVNGAQAVKSFVLGMVGMAKQAITTAVTALPSLIASVWSFTAALLANPITWVVVGIVALIAALVLLWRNWDSVVSFIKGVFSGFVNGVVNGFNWIREKISSLPAVFQVLLAAIFPIIGIPMLIANNWESIVTFFSNLWTRVKETFSNGINSIKEFITGTLSWFRESGSKILTTFTEGIKSAISKPVEAVKGGLAKIRQMLPFSDAKEGPLSTLTLSGRRVLETITTGIHQREDMPADAVEDSFKNIDFTTTKKAIAKVNLKEAISGETNSDDSSSTDKGKNVIIQKLLMNVDFSKIKELKQLIKLLAEIEDYTNGNGEETDDMPIPEPI
ncbi:phage tail tape measure protein [Bacteroidales bacterium MSK.15.36]|nr:phage tail tape measure protein [Bacteroidales bacterium MSK.15.36]